jgi:hypothetical protein
MLAVMGHTVTALAVAGAGIRTGTISGIAAAFHMVILLYNK